MSFLSTPTSTTEIYTLSLHDALPIFQHVKGTDRVEPCLVVWLISPEQRVVAAIAYEGIARAIAGDLVGAAISGATDLVCSDRKSTRLNSSHGYISHAVFCLKKKQLRL